MDKHSKIMVASLALGLASGVIGTAQLKDGAVTSAKIRDSSVTVRDLSASARPQLPRSISAKDRPWGALTWEGVEIARLTLPAGSWYVAVKAATMTPGGITCNLRRGTTTVDLTYDGSAASWAYGSVALLAPKLAGGATVTARCSGSPEASVGEVVISAVEVR